MSEREVALSKKDRKPRKVVRKTGKPYQHTYVQLYAFPPPYLPPPKYNPGTEEKALVDWVQVQRILVGMFAQSNMSFVSKLRIDDDTSQEGDGEAGGKAKNWQELKKAEKEKERAEKKAHPPKKGAAAAAAPAPAAAGDEDDKKAKEKDTKGKGKSKGKSGDKDKEKDKERDDKPQISRKDQMIRDARIEREKDQAEKDVKRLLAPGAVIATMAVQSATGRIAHNLCLIKHYWSQGNKSDALDVWLDIGFTTTSLLELLNTEFDDDDDIDYVELNGDFIYPELLGEVYEACLDTLKPFIKWLKEIKDQTELFQLEHMGDRLVPLNHKAFKQHRLDDWQIRALKHMSKKESLLVCAPTSSGKTIISTYLVFSIVGNPKVPKSKFIIVAVPSPALAMQVGSMYMHSLKAEDPTAQVWVLCEQLEIVSDEQRPRVIVGTPEMLETVLLKYNSSVLNMFDCEALVVDEIHNLAKSASMERLIHMLPQAFVLGLSATMGNPGHLHGWLQSVKKDRPVHLEVVTQRFFNLQQHVFSAGEVIPVSPLAAISPETLAVAAKTDIPFTPYETVRLYNTIQPHLSPESQASLKPSTFFTAAMARDGLNRISLGQAREYGRELVTQLSTLPAEAQQAVFRTFHLNEISEDIDLYALVNKLRSRKDDKNMLPALAFSLDSVTCFHAFHELLQRLEYEEAAAFPGRRAKLRRLAREYERAIEKWDAAYERLNNDEARSEYERENPRPSPPEEENKPHSNFVVGRPLISEEEITELYTSLKDTVTESYFDKCRRDIKTFIKPYIEGLRRGIALYTKHMPVFYVRHAQRLAQDGALGLVISDDSLAHGVNMPFRTVVFHGDHPKLTPLMVQQMAGRAGRRGLDRSGHVVYMGFSAARVTHLMSVASPDVTGMDVRNPLVAALSTVTNGQEEKFIFTGLLSTFFNPLFEHREGVKRTPEQLAAHNASCKARVGEARRIVELVPQKFRRILFALRDIPEALQLCAAVLPILHDLDLSLRSGMDAEPIQLFNVLGRYLQSIPGTTSWESPTEDWAVALLSSIKAELSAKRASGAGAFPDLPDPTDDAVFHAFVLNSVAGLCKTNPTAAATAAAAAAAAAPAAAAAAAVSDTPVAAADDEDGAEDADGADGADGASPQDLEEESESDIELEQATISAGPAVFAYQSPLGDIDVARLYDIKERLTAAMTTMLTIRNECAERSRESKPWLGKRDYIPVGWARNETFLRFLFRRIYYLILEYPF